MSTTPPAVIVAAGHDVLLDDAQQYAARLQQAGVSVEYLVWERQCHVFSYLGVAQSEPALARIALAMNGLLTGSYNGNTSKL